MSQYSRCSNILYHFFFIIWQAISLFHFWVNFITNLPILNRGIFRSTLTFHIREALNWYQQYKKVIHRYHKHKYTHPLLIVFIHITASSKVECKTNSSPRSTVRCMDCIHAQSFHPTNTVQLWSCSNMLWITRFWLDYHFMYSNVIEE